jgi:hypothetical protein
MRILGLSHQMKLHDDKLHQGMVIKRSDVRGLSKGIYVFKQL